MVAETTETPRDRRSPPDGPRPPSRPGVAAAAAAAHPGGGIRVPQWLRLRSITWRVLAVNLLALLILAAGLLYLDRYKRSLIASQLDSLAVQGGIFAAALGEAAVISDPLAGQDTLTALARPMVRRLAVPARLRARLFAANGDLIADSKYVGMVRGGVEVAPLATPREDARLLDHLVDAYEWLVRRLPAGESYPPYEDKPSARAADFREAQRALAGEVGRSVRAAPGGELVLSVAVPVQRYKQVLGALMLSVDSAEIEESLRQVRQEIISVFGIVFVITVLLSLWLAGTIARPVRRLAAAAERVRSGHGQAAEIPDLSGRGDEIGNLSAALRDMTRDLWSRMDAIEGFAADVAHEIKNPLSSLRSAVETVARIDNPAQQRRLMAIILDDVQRLDRLISDISDASRLDAELGRAQLSRVDMADLLRTLVEIEQTAAQAGGAPAPRLTLDLPGDRPIVVLGLEGRLAQVFRNLIANAVSFSPPHGTIRVSGRIEDGLARFAVEDEGPGLPPEKIGAIFDRFYSERPRGEKFGTHSGLGLSISKQIVEAHHGRIWAENVERDGAVAGARFVVTLDLAGHG